jgi:lipoprotein-releasing system ATP-binding protein
MLSLKNISKSFPQRGVVLSKLSLNLEAGETLAITGPSGSGKTTLLNIIGLLDSADSGSIIYKGSNIEKYDAEQSALYRRESIGFVFQDHLLLPHLTVIENIYPPLLAGKETYKSFEESRSYIDNLLKDTGISEIVKRYPHEISGGEAQRATLVRALVNKPLLLLADEPTGSLDTKNSDALGALLLEINTIYKTAIIAVTHSDRFAKKLGKQLHLLNGQLETQN